MPDTKPPVTVFEPLEPNSSDADKLAWILESIRAILQTVVHSDPPALEEPMQTRFKDQWPAILTTMNAAIQFARNNYSTLVPNLEAGGMTGDMLALKAENFDRCIKGLNTEVKTSSPLWTWKWLRPTLKCANTLLFSLIRTLPGVEAIKEFKDHFEVSLDVAEIKRKG